MWPFSKVKKSKYSLDLLSIVCKSTVRFVCKPLIILSQASYCATRLFFKPVNLWDLGETDITDLVPFGFFLCYSPETRKALWEYINTARWFFLLSCIYKSVVEMPFGVWLQSIEIKCVWDLQIRGRKEALEANSKWTGRSLTRPKLIETYFGRRGGFFMYCLTIGSLLYCMWANWKCFY